MGPTQRNCPNGPPARGAGRGVGIPIPRPVVPTPTGYRPSFPVGVRVATCFKCGGPNHYARDCQAQTMKCYACGKLVGHPFPRAGLESPLSAGPGAHLAGLHGPQRRAAQHRREEVLPVRRSRTYLPGMPSSGASRRRFRPSPVRSRHRGWAPCGRPCRPGPSGAHRGCRLAELLSTGPPAAMDGSVPTCLPHRVHGRLFSNFFPHCVSLSSNSPCVSFSHLVIIIVIACKLLTQSVGCLSQLRSSCDEIL